LMILPLPSWLLDFLLATNISCAVVLLLLALHVGEALRVAVFPTLLLVTTLFRLSLNVSTTRLILLRADAGSVVNAFGNFVAGGNPLVGGVLFLILTVVQFIVVAKGAERVAEVGARFSLDGMPGKQMSIDADLRAGVIDQQQAALKRARLEQESQFYGAMDGAMKFVKGDAIAGIIITLVNITGGLLVGVVQHGFSLSEAVSRYTVLTIGDGLVSQIPALLITTASGLVVTRVRGERAPSRLGNQVVLQIREHPQVPLMAGGVLCLVGLVPGMPTLSFGVLGLMLAVAGWRMAAGMQDAEGESSEKESERRICICLPRSAKLDESDLELVRTEIGDELGISLPRMRLEMTGGSRLEIWLDGVPIALEQAAADAGQKLKAVLKRHAARLIGVQQVQDMLDRLDASQPALVREVVPRLIPPVLLTEILCRLLEEGVSVRNLGLILQTLAEWARHEADPAALAERVRMALGTLITHQVAPEGRLEAWLLDPEVEQVVERSLHQADGRTMLAIEPRKAESLLDGMKRAAARSGNSLVVVTRPEIRRPLWKMAASAVPGLRVISYLELDPDTEIVPVGRLSFDATKGGSS
ncbi:MAG: hypothetical protein D6806_04665, partial [Deltaproteobacteria bacterium]